MNQYPEWSAQNSLPPSASAPIRRELKTNPVLDIARIGAFSALVAVGTIISNVLFGFALPYPLGEYTAVPVFYLAISFVFSRKVTFWSTATCFAIAESIYIFFFGLSSSIFVLTFFF